MREDNNHQNHNIPVQEYTGILRTFAAGKTGTGPVSFTASSTLLDAIPVALALVSPEGMVALCNKQWEDLAAVEGNCLERRISAEIKRVITGSSKGFSTEYTCLVAGQHTWLKVCVNPYQWPDGMGAVVLCQDITEKKTATEALERSESNLLAVVNSTNDLIFSLDTHFRYVAFNKAHSEMLYSIYGITIQPGDLVFGFLSTAEPAAAAEWKSIYQQALSGMPVQFIKDYSIPGTPAYFRFSVNPIWSEGKVVGISCFARNITAKKLAQDKVVELNNMLEQKVKERTAELESANHELEAFTYTVSHDLRSPLRNLAGLTRVLLKEHSHALNSEGVELLEMISNNAQRMNRLVQDLLDFSRMGKAAIQRTPVNMMKLVESVVEELEAGGAGRNACIKINGLADTECDPALVKQVWVNLVSNALKYSARQPAPVVEIGMTGGDKPVYYIKDNGAGFCMKHAGRLFEAFHRLHDHTEYEGTGVGLATVKRIIEKHEGRVWAESVENEGATFYFTLKSDTSE